jgi:GDSL-like Lipase/Acylhydrolase family
LKKGFALARRAIRRRSERAPKRRAARMERALLVAEGDSWFACPLYDVLDLLERGGYEVESVAHMGDNLEDMAHDELQLDRLTKVFEKVQRRGDAESVRAVLLSGGGNDIAGEEFAIVLNHANSGLDPLNDKVVEGLIDERLRQALLSLIGTAMQLSEHYFGEPKPVVIHGYGYAVPDGRGFLGGGWILPGPWLEPGFRRKGYPELARNAGVVRKLITRYNAMMKDVASRLAGVHYVDVRPLLSSELDHRRYRDDWGNELHPTERGFQKVAAAFAAVLRSV